MKYITPSWYLPVDPPPIPPEHRLEVEHTAKWDMVMGVCELKVRIRGPDHMVVVIDDRYQPCIQTICTPALFSLKPGAFTEQPRNPNPHTKPKSVS